MIERIKTWLIHKLGGCTQEERRDSWEYFSGRALYWRNRAVLNSREAKSWEKQFREADSKLAGIVVLNERTCQLVPLRAEIREGMEKFRGSMIPMEELEDWIKRRLAAQLGGGVLAQIGVSRVDDHKNMEFVWACEAYLLKMEEKQ